MKLLSIISQNGALLAPRRSPRWSSCSPADVRRDQRHRRFKHRFVIQRRRDKGDIQREQDDGDPKISMVWLKIVSPRRFSIIGSAPYFQRSGTAPPSG
jgi:hypothetical protein